MSAQFNFILLFVVIAFSTSQGIASQTSNKEVVTSFYNKAFNDHDPIEAMRSFVGNQYIQHNPFVGDGKEPFVNFFLESQKKHLKAHIQIKRIVAEGDLVVVHVHSKLDEKDLGRAVMDIFRLENGKIVEHWDVGQSVPEKSANNNTMF